MMGDEVARTATYTYTFWHAGATGKVYARDSFYDTVTCSCDHDVAGESYLKVDNMVLANSDADDVSFDVTDTGIASTTSPVSLFGGAKVLLAGNNLAGVNFVFVGDSLFQHGYESPNLVVILPTQTDCLQIDDIMGDHHGYLRIRLCFCRSHMPLRY